VNLFSEAQSSTENNTQPTSIISGYGPSKHDYHHSLFRQMAAQKQEKHSSTNEK